MSNTLRHASVLVLLMSAKASRPASNAPRNSIRSSSGSHDVKLTLYMLFDETGPDVGEECCMVAAAVKSKHRSAAFSLRCEIECFETRPLQVPGPQIDPWIVYLGEHQLSALSCSTRSKLSTTKVAQLSQTVSLQSKRWERELSSEVAHANTASIGASIVHQYRKIIPCTLSSS